MPSPDDKAPAAPQELLAAIGGEPGFTGATLETKHPDGSPMFLDELARYDRLKKAGLPTGWSLLSKGEMIIMDRNFRQLVLSYNTLADTAYAQRNALEQAYNHTECLPEAMENMIEDALALKLPTRSNPGDPQPPPPPR